MCAAQARQVKTMEPLIILAYLTEETSLNKNSPMLTLTKVTARRHSGCVKKLIFKPLGMYEGGLMYAAWRPAPYLTSGMNIIISMNTTIWDEF